MKTAIDMPLSTIRCRYCTRETAVKRDGRKLFCSDACRARAHREGVDGEVCTYCGDPRQEMDHIPPLSLRRRFPRLVDKFPYLIVPCCSECNHLLNNRAVFTVEKRKRYIRAVLARKYRAILGGPVWTNAEIAEMSERFQTTLAGRRWLKLAVQSRIAYAELAPIDRTYFVEG